MTDPADGFEKFARDEKPNGGGRAPSGGAASGGHNDAAQAFQAPIYEITKIPPRAWAYGKFLLFGSAAVIGAMDGSGKGMLATVIALAFITGEPLLGEKVWRRGPVAILTYEDDEDEWARRFAAACLHYNTQGYHIDYATVMQSVHFIRKPSGDSVVLASSLDGGVVFPDHDAIIAALTQIDAVLWIIDPFNNAHSLEDGNSNALVAAVAGEISRIARACNVAALLLHHLRKGAVGSVDDLMGAVALRANFRSCRILQVMTAEIAGQLGIPHPNAWRYLRVAGSKENYAPPIEQATWYQKVSVPLDNGADIYVDGDEIGVVTKWSPPKAFEGLGYPELRTVFDELTAQPHAKAPQTKAIPWVGRPLMQQGRNEDQAKRIINLWLQNGVLVEGEPFRSESRNTVQTLQPDPVQVAKLLGPLAAAEGVEDDLDG